MIIVAKQSYYEWETKLIAEQFPSLRIRVTRARAEELVDGTLKALGHHDKVQVRFLTREQADKLVEATSSAVAFAPGCGLGGFASKDRKTICLVGETISVRTVLHECVHIRLGVHRGHGKQFRRMLLATFKWLHDYQQRSPE